MIWVPSGWYHQVLNIDFVSIRVIPAQLGYNAGRADAHSASPSTTTSYRPPPCRWCLTRWSKGRSGSRGVYPTSSS